MHFHPDYIAFIICMKEPMMSRDKTVYGIQYLTWQFKKSEIGGAPK